MSQREEHARAFGSDGEGRPGQEQVVNPGEVLVEVRAGGGSPYRSGRSPDWLKMKNPEAPAVKREAIGDVRAVRF